MYLRFVTEGYRTDYELYGTQGESLVGLYDGLRSAILEVTTDDVRFDDIIRKSAIAFASQETGILIVDNEESPGILFYTFPNGLGKLASQIAAELGIFARNMQVSFQVSPQVLVRLRKIDVEFDIKMLCKPLAVVQNHG